MDTETPKYRKKKPQTSKSDKRSTHKHDYYRVIAPGWVMGWAWYNRCKICGRMESKCSWYWNDFLKEDRIRDPGISDSSFMDVSSIHKKFPDSTIFVYDDKKELVALVFDD